MIHETLSSARWYVVNLWHWSLQYRRRRQLPKRIVHFDLRRNEWHRYLHILILFFNDQGWQVRVRHRWRFIGSWASNDLFQRSGVFRLYFGDRLADGNWLITDRPASGEHNRLDADYFTLPNESPSGIRVPMPMVDSQYIEGLHRRPVKDPGQVRRRALFFFGNMDVSSYADEAPSRVFGCFRRPILFDLLRKHFPQRLHEPETLAEIDSRPECDIVLMDRHKEYIRPSALPDMLERFDLFLAPSGLAMPLCHNIVEAMFAGCIPVLQHPHLMDPPLRHGIDCIAFGNEEELKSAIEQLPLMSAGEIERMRRAVLDYCSKHLTPAAVMERLQHAHRSSQCIHLNAEYPSVMILERRAHDTGQKLPLPIPGPN